jgi:hypothetical protein
MKKSTEQQKNDSRGALTPEFLKRFAFLAVANGEVGSTNPYASSLSTGESGLAFGRMQNDTRNKTGNTIAQTYLRKILDADVAGNHLDQEKADALYEKTLESPRALTKVETQVIDDALGRHPSLVDEADKQQFEKKVLPALEKALDAAEINPNGPGDLNRENADLRFVAELAMWGNRSNGLKETSDYLSKMPSITRTAWEQNYLRHQEQYTRKKEQHKKGKKKPKESFKGWLEKVKRATDYAERNARMASDPESEPETVPVPTSTMLPYGGPDGSSGAVAYRIDGDSITVRFRDRPTLYVYDATQPGLGAVQEMQRLAKQGSGLTTYINQHIRKNYAFKVG